MFSSLILFNLYTTTTTTLTCFIVKIHEEEQFPTKTTCLSYLTIIGNIQKKKKKKKKTAIRDAQESFHWAFFGYAIT